jgi:hypothetical protein
MTNDAKATPAYESKRPDAGQEHVEKASRWASGRQDETDDFVEIMGSDRGTTDHGILKKTMKSRWA